MFDHDPFGDSGGAGGIDDIGEMSGGEPEACRVEIALRAASPTAIIGQVKNRQSLLGVGEEVPQMVCVKSATGALSSSIKCSRSTG